MNKQELIDDIEKNKNEFYKLCTDMKSAGISRGIGTGIYMGLLISQKKIERLDEQPKVTVPKFAADWFEKNKEDLTFAIYEAVAHSIKEAGYKHYSDEFMGWFAHSDNNSIETLIRMKDGYEVEKEPLYQIELPGTSWGAYLTKADNGDLVIFQNTTSGSAFTETEIKAIDERYWAFAVPVEEVK